MIDSNMGIYESNHLFNISSNGKYLEKAINTSNVNNLWLPHVHIHWDTGTPDLSNLNVSKSTHCSAFVAAFANKLNIYILHPPEHGQTLLANAQVDWLTSNIGKEHGWVSIDGAKEAQLEANKGNLVLATWKNTNPDKPGHIAIVRPSQKSEIELYEKGPDIAQAGTFNSVNTSADMGFKHHVGRWILGGSKSIQYFSHPVSPDKLKEALSF